MDLGSNSKCRIAIAVFLRDGSVLLGKRSSSEKNFPDYWEFPGGKLEAGETPEEALSRELREELGCELRAWTHLRSMEVDYCGRQMEVNFFKVELCSEDPQLMKKNAHSELKWFRLEEALQIPMLPANQEFIRELRHSN